MKTSARIAFLPLSAPLKGEILLPLTAFLAPFLVSGPQWLTGTLVNCLLVLAGLALSRRALALTVILPSLGALAHGALFGPFTPFLVFFLPVIWMGNALFVSSQCFLARFLSAPQSVLAGALLKTALLYGVALLYVNLHWVPPPFLVAMGAIQFVTALAGGWMALGILSFSSKR